MFDTCSRSISRSWVCAIELPSPRAMDSSFLFSLLIAIALPASSQTQSYSLVGDGFCCDGSSGRTHFTASALSSSYPNLDDSYQTQSSSPSTNGWFTSNTTGTGMCYIQSVPNCATICAAVSGCSHFSISETVASYCCFLYSSCPDGASNTCNSAAYQVL